MFSSRRAASVALAATLLIAACGSDDDSGSASGNASDTTVSDTTVAATTPETTVADTTPETTVADTTPETTAAPAQDVEADTAAATAALLTLADLPEGWTEAPAGDDTADIAGSLAACVGVDSMTSSEASATTGDFASPDGGLVVSERVGLQATERDARLVLAGLTNPDVPTCLAAAYSESGAAALSAGAIADGAEIGEITASRLAVGSAGDATQAIRVVIPVTAAGATTEITVDHVIARADRSIASLVFEGRTEPTTVETIDAITATAASRLPA